MLKSSSSSGGPVGSVAAARSVEHVPEPVAGTLHLRPYVRQVVTVQRPVQGRTIDDGDAALLEGPELLGIVREEPNPVDTRCQSKRGWSITYATASSSAQLA